MCCYVNQRYKLLRLEYALHAISILLRFSEYSTELSNTPALVD